MGAAPTNDVVSVFGATGFTGRLVLEQLRARGIAARAIGRSEEKLARLVREHDAADHSAPPLETRQADATLAESVRRAVEGSRILIACAGPFMEFGRAAAEAAVQEGIHYLDTTGEQTFARWALDGLDAKAREAGLAMVNSMAYEIAPADLAASMLATGMGDLEDVVVAYAVSSKHVSRGTALSILNMMEAGGQRWAADTWVRDVPGRIRGRVRFARGRRSWTMSIPSVENLTIPRHVTTHRCTTVMQLPGGLVAGAALLGRALPAILRSPIGSMLRQRASLGPDGPTPAERARQRFEIVVEAYGQTRFRRASIHGFDPYGLTGWILGEAAERLLSGDGVRPGATGVLAPAQLFQPAEFLAGLAGSGLSLDIEEGPLGA